MAFESLKRIVRIQHLPDVLNVSDVFGPPAGQHLKRILHELETPDAKPRLTQHQPPYNPSNTETTNQMKLIESSHVCCDGNASRHMTRTDPHHANKSRRRNGDESHRGRAQAAVDRHRPTTPRQPPHDPPPPTPNTRHDSRQTECYFSRPD